MSKIVILGANGQLGQALCKTFSEFKPLALGREQADFMHPKSWLTSLFHSSPEVIINAAAYTAVDKAEEEPEMAQQVNSITPGLLAQACAYRDVSLIHFSTDYVFSGQGHQPWSETDPCEPCNSYGKSKLEGERAVLSENGNFLIFRLAWLYQNHHRNFFSQILETANEKKEIPVVEDQIGHPSYAGDVASWVYHVLKKGDLYKTGIYHLASKNPVSRAEFAEEIIANGFRFNLCPQVSIKRISTPEAAAVKRPLNTRLDLEHFEKTFHFQLSDWKSGLLRCLRGFL